MSARYRLTLLYSLFVGGILLIFGAAVYLLFTLSSLSRTDAALANAAERMIAAVRIKSDGSLVLLNLPALRLSGGVAAQIWDERGGLYYVSPDYAALNQPLDSKSLSEGAFTFRNVVIGETRWRVLTIPLSVGGRRAGFLQAGMQHTLQDKELGDLILILLGTALAASLTAALGSWVLLGRALASLREIAETVDQINRADDLSRRIPYAGNREDEIGNLVESFNQTLERLETLFTSQQRFLADVSHELRTPLTVIKGNVDLIRRLKTADEDSLASIDQEAGRLTRLVGGLLMLAQAEAGKLALNFAPVELDLLLTEVFTEMSVLAGTKVKVHLNEIDQALTLGDRDRLKQVFLNLISNAIQYTPPGGEIFISLKRFGDQARVIVRDTGPGIPAEDLPHIFERFYRAEKSRARSASGGFGLGLSITKWIVERHNGRIEAESKEGEGTSFVVWLPAGDTSASVND